MTDPKPSSRRNDGIPASVLLPPEGERPVSDAVIRRIGAHLLAGDVPGIAIIMGSADCAAHVSLLTDLYSDMGLAVCSAGTGCAGVQNALAALERMAEIFCGVSPEDGAEALRCALARLPAVFIVPEQPDAESEGLLRKAEALGIPVLRELGTETEPASLAKRSLEAGNIRLKPKPLALPVRYDSSFEGERVRDGRCAVEFTDACELVCMAEPSAVEDHRFTLVGRDVPTAGEGIAVMHLALAVRVSGGKMQRDFESVIEHRIDRWLNYAEGVEHRGSRGQVRLRLSREALEKGLRLADLAEIVYHGVRTEFAPVAEKCEVVFITDAEAWAEFLENTALPRYAERNARLAALTDEAADTFYTCTMCQSIAPRHCCVVTPERSGMCGAVTWPDAKAAFELDPNGPNRPVEKGALLDARLGEYAGVNSAVTEASGGAVTRLSLYSVLENPMSGCGRLECICCFEPLSGGVILVDRDYTGMTPVGMSFEDLASTVFGGVQCPGFLGVGRQYITSGKFLAAEGGTPRIVWMTRALKTGLSAGLNAAARRSFGIDRFCEKIADETVCTDPEALLAFLTEKGHPVLGMEPLL